ncbi:transcriptional regulator [Actinocatenispora thailandica]|uniref:Transcriptional regulator n=1 Tax=Actinocatenispora thailandica TaxID=227318 RepID=A0A7R7DM81_9ACTN|nr:TetR/AcrR family transcriptional regulator [Actinocatenispora thailandica]BCJ34081.1 transcriptional regulator [Actinocatenispora thailandica]
MPRAALTVASIVDTAGALADEVGFEAVSLSEVARRLGVRAPSLYAHVRDLAALRDGITEAALRELGSRIALATAGRSGRTALRGLMQAHRGFASEAPGRWQSLQRRADQAVAASEAARSVVALTGAVLRGYALPESEHVHAIRLLGGAIAGYLALERAGSFAYRDPEPDVSWERAVDALDALLRHWPAAPPQEGPRQEKS